jgi:hypothetical protein
MSSDFLFLESKMVEQHPTHQSSGCLVAFDIPRYSRSMQSQVVKLIVLVLLDSVVTRMTKKLP